MSQMHQDTDNKHTILRMFPCISAHDNLTVRSLQQVTVRRRLCLQYMYGAVVGAYMFVAMCIDPHCS